MKESTVEYQKVSSDNIEIDLELDERGHVSGVAGKRGGYGHGGHERGVGVGEEDEDDIRQEEEDRKIDNFEQHFLECYKYFQMKGFQSFFLTRLFGILTVLWIMFVILVLLEFVDYKALRQDDEDNNAVLDMTLPTNPLFYVVLIVGLTYSIVLFVKFTWAVPRYWRIRRLFTNLYGIPEIELETIEWDRVAKRISNAIQWGRDKNATEIDQLRMTQLIMRKENYFLSLLMSDIFTERTKRLFSRYFVSLFGDLVIRPLLDRISEMSDSRKPEIIHQLRVRLIVLSLLLLLISPFVFVYQMMTIGVSFVEELRSKAKSISTRQWSTFGYWEVRNFNELDHFVSERLTKAAPYSSAYIDMFFSSVLTAVSRFVVFVCATIVVLCLGLEFIFDNFMTTELFGRSFFWYAGVATAVLVVARSLIPPDNMIIDTKKAFSQIYLFTQYKPKSWNDKEHTPFVLRQFERLYDYRILVTLREVFSAFIAPVILLTYVNVHLDSIYFVIANSSDYVEGLGWISSYSNFGIGHSRFFKSVVKKSGDRGMRSKRGKLETSLCNFMDA